MTYHITSNAGPIDTATHTSINAALVSATAPGWAGAKPKEITMIDATTYKSGGMVYNIVAGENPKAARAAAPAKTAAAARDAHRPYQAKAGWLSREMDRADSDY